MTRRKVYAIAGAGVAVALGAAGAALATSGGDDAQMTGPAAARARSAALHYLGGGRGGSVERDGEHGATYDVEVHGTDGSVRDVWLDQEFHPITSELDEEGA